jgi:hypothetical protein
MELGSEEDFMKTISKVMLVSAATLLTGASYAADINLTPADCVVGSCWTIVGDNSNPTVDEIETLVGTSTQLTRVYKQDQGGPEEGAFASSYTTEFFNTPTDPSGATISYNGAPAPAITCPECYLVIKDGNANPSSYVFALGNWDGTGVITMADFWPDNGAISHVEIVASEVPLPAAVWLFGSGLVALAGIKRRRKSA